MSVPPPPPSDWNPSDPSLPPPVGAYGGYPPPPPYPGYFAVDAWGRPVSDKSKLVAGLLQSRRRAV